MALLKNNLVIVQTCNIQVIVNRQLYAEANFKFLVCDLILFCLSFATSEACSYLFFIV